MPHVTNTWKKAGGTEGTMSHQLAHSLFLGIQAFLTKTQGTASRSTWQGQLLSCTLKSVSSEPGDQDTLKVPLTHHLRTPFRKWILVPPPGSLNPGGSAKDSGPINTSSGTIGMGCRGWKLLSKQVGHLAFQRLLQSPLCSPGGAPL